LEDGGQATKMDKKLCRPKQNKQPAKSHLKRQAVVT